MQPIYINTPVTVTIFSGETTSTIANLNGSQLVNVAPDSTMSGTQLTFLGSQDGTNFYEIQGNGGNAQTMVIKTSNNGAQPVPDKNGFLFAQYIKVVSSAGGGEAADRVITLFSRPLS